MNSFPQRIFVIFMSLVVVAVIALAMMPQPVSVDLAAVTRGELVVTITDDGRTRIRERYVVSAPLDGRLVRIRLKPGDQVLANETLLTTIEPTDPTLLDPRSVAEAEARVKAAEARLSHAGPSLESAQVAMNHEETELGRLQELARKNAGSQQDLDAQLVDFQRSENEFESARFEVEIAGFELEVAKAALTRNAETEPSDRWDFPVRSPISGRILRVFQESSTIVNAGERILEVGDPGDLEIEVDVLSTEAVRIRPGNRVLLEQWGGNHPIAARVRLVEPSAFMKVSALGIEEQRVNIIADFVEPAESRPPLADGYQVEASIVEWEDANVLKVPTGALYRHGDSWAVFVVKGDKARRTQIEIGHRNDDEAEVLDGLTEGDQIVLYPGDLVEDGVSIKQRLSP